MSPGCLRGLQMKMMKDYGRSQGVLICCSLGLQLLVAGFDNVRNLDLACVFNTQDEVLFPQMYSGTEMKRVHFCHAMRVGKRLGKSRGNAFLNSMIDI